MYILRFFCFAALFCQTFACFGKKRVPPAAQGNVWQRMVGNPVTPTPYTSSGDLVTQNCNDLSCTFDSGCCWSNANPPTDQLDWVTVSGQPEPAKMQSSFGSQTMPTGNKWLGDATETGNEGSPQTAQLYSCLIQCTGSVTVNLNQWHTRDITMQVCQEDTLNGPPENCQPLLNNGQADSATLPGGSQKRLVIVANGFTLPGGSVAMIDNVKVTCSPCNSVTQPPAGNPCGKITCNFEGGNPCSYTNARGGDGGTKSWEVVQSPYKNPLTGIPTAAEGNSFAGSYLAPHDTAVLTTDISYPQNYIVKFFGYRATEGIDLLACCGGANSCPYSTTNQVQISDFRSWKPATITCPQGTNKVLFVARNTGKNVGAVGLDNIQLLVPSGQPC